MTDDILNTFQQKMNDHQIVNTYLALSDQLYKQYNDRRTLEWRIHITLWTFLALIVYLCVTNKIHLGDYSIFIFIVIPIHIIWIIKIVSGEIKEQELSILYRKEVDKIIGFEIKSKQYNGVDDQHYEERSKIPNWMRKRFQSYYWWFGVQLSTTTFMCLGVWWLVK